MGDWGFLGVYVRVYGWLGSEWGLVGVWKAFGGCLVGVSQGSGGCLGDV